VGTVCFKTFGAGKLLANTRGYGQPIEGQTQVPSRPALPHLTVPECVHYTLTLDPDVALLGMSTRAEIDAAVTAAAEFQPLDAERMDDIRRRAAVAVQGKGRCHWNPQ
jgi:hypothetical protein